MANAWRCLLFGSASFKLVMRIRAPKLALRQWNRDVFGEVQGQIKSLQDQLVAIQS